MNGPRGERDRATPRGASPGRRVALRTGASFAVGAAALAAIDMPVRGRFVDVDIDGATDGGPSR